MNRDEVSSAGERIIATLSEFEIRLCGWMERNGLFLLRISIGIVFIWFGILKPLGLSPAEKLVINTTS